MGFADFVKNSWILMTKSGRVNRNTRQIAWEDNVLKQTSDYLRNIHKFVAREFSKLEIDHRESIRDGDKYRSRNKLGSQIYEVLNFSPNGELNNTAFKRKIAEMLMSGVNVYLKPIYQDSKLQSLEFTTSEEYNKDPENTIVFTSGINASRNQELYNQVLTTISSSINHQSLRGYLKINATIGAVDFEQKVKEQLALLQNIATTPNGLGFGVLDGKSELIELKKDYSPISKEMVDVVKSEILTGYGISEDLMRGKYTADDYKNFFNNVINPMVIEIEKELTYKLLSTNKRVNNGDKQSFERLEFSQDVFKFATVKELTDIAHVNVNGAFLTVNEVRKLFGKDPVEGGDEFRTNLNSVGIKYDEGDVN